MKQAIIIMNPSSGKEEAPAFVDSAAGLLRAQGYETMVKETEAEGDATRFCAEACAAGCELVVSIGGDGTLHETINGFEAQAHRPRLGIVPLGTVNDFARALHIPLDPPLAIAALASSRTRRVDIGRLNGRLFANVVAAGPLAETLSAVSSEDKSRFGALAYFKEGVKDLLGRPGHPFVIRYDGTVWEGESPLFIAALTNSVGGFERLAPDAAVDDGLIHGFIVKDLSFFRTLTAGLSLLRGHLQDHKDVIYFTAKQVSVSSPSLAGTNVDGEEGPLLPLELDILPRHIDVLVPEPDAVTS
ncbi:diacylglycerol/lipid kinase family protein [Cohnella hashimotonis]|uniref:YegS/Rv2252/BmrU family lipid kinase n=1 Tax=Cohnella hashimotonis TaxID=2826895 RepID=A0ABT6TS90_9BACL|nr:YegS/Rv2252/BmrU family lipid kinase [Cohnella hashimotonis]MDI4649698.1 YegS/Rv2252/BmrU family lipid kinase [Cohnella hashimotonis]